MGLWVVGCEDTELHTHEIQGNSCGMQRCSAVGYAAAGMQDMGIQGCRMRDARP